MKIRVILRFDIDTLIQGVSGFFFSEFLTRLEIFNLTCMDHLISIKLKALWVLKILLFFNGNTVFLFHIPVLQTNVFNATYASYHYETVSK